MKKTIKTNKEIADYLIAKDKKMAKVIGADYIVERNIGNDYFSSLVETIVSQQISGKEADVICGRLTLLCGKRITVSAIDGLSDEQLGSIGISRAKVKYIRSLAEAVDNGTVDLKHIHKMKNEDIIEMLTKVKGIGVWSAEMFLIFSLAREDVFSCLDGALVKAVSHYYFKDQPVNKEQLLKLSKKWAPYRTYASLYLWNSLARF